jgi:large subunit ribosomal protein L13
MQKQNQKFDIEGQSLGRAASAIAMMLMGKNKPDYEPHRDIGDGVVVSNINKVEFTGNKLRDKKYFSFSGYPGGLKQKTLEQIKHGKGLEEILRKAVWNMLPKNKLRQKRIKRLTFE